MCLRRVRQSVNARNPRPENTCRSQFGHFSKHRWSIGDLCARDPNAKSSSLVDDGRSVQVNQMPLASEDVIGPGMRLAPNRVEDDVLLG
jgi:hypothetical protein